MNKTLSIKNLSVELRVGDNSKKLLNNVNIALKSGKITALIGKSGSGKSLTCYAMQGFLAENLIKTSGDIYLNDQKINPKDARGKVFSTIMQNPRTSFNPLYTMKFHAIETLKAVDKYDNGYKQKIIQTMENVGLQDAEHTYGLYPFQMSGGMLQRMALALSMLSESSFLLADEPTTDLDLLVQAKIIDFLKSDLKSKGLGILIITHDFGIVAKIADEVVVMNEGKVIEEGSVKEIFTNPKELETKELLNAHLALYRSLDE